MIGSKNVASSARNIFNLVVSLRAYPDTLRVVGACADGVALLCCSRITTTKENPCVWSAR